MRQAVWLRDEDKHAKSRSVKKVRLHSMPLHKRRSPTEIH